MPYHMVRARRFEDLYKHVLFNYEWLHAKLSSCPLQAVLSDFEDACSNIEDREATRSVRQYIVGLLYVVLLGHGTV
jgi:hypothetical protein